MCVDGIGQFSKIRSHSYSLAPCSAKSLLLSQFPVRWFPCCIRSVAVGHITVHKLVFVVQLASIGQKVPGEQLLCANTSRDSSETTWIKTHTNVLVAIAGAAAQCALMSLGCVWKILSKAPGTVTPVPSHCRLNTKVANLVNVLTFKLYI